VQDFSDKADRFHDKIADHQDEYKDKISDLKDKFTQKQGEWKKKFAGQHQVLAAVAELQAPGISQLGNMSAQESIVIGSGVLLAMVGIAASMPSKKKKEATVEFEIGDEEAPKKESKKQIKKTLENIMKKNNAKTTLMW